MECFRILNEGLPLGCTLNPVLGREFEWGDEKLVRNGDGRTVAVVGAGPAGMQAALTLAKRGFRPVIFEASDKAGGTVNLATVPPNKGMLGEFVETLQEELKENNVTVKLNTPGTLEAVKAIGAEGVFLTTGGTPVKPDLPGIEKALTAEDVLAGRAEVKGDNVVVIGGGVTGLETAETLSKDHKVTVVEMLDKVGGSLYPSVVMHLAGEIMKAGGVIAKGKKLVEVADGKVTVADTKTEEVSEIPADTVVLAMGVRPDRTLYAELKEAFGNDLVLVGDTAKAGQIYDALHCAHDRAFVFKAQ